MKVIKEAFAKDLDALTARVETIETVQERDSQEMSELKEQLNKMDVQMSKHTPDQDLDDNHLDSIVKHSLSRVNVVSKENLEMAVNTALLKEFEDKINELIKVKKLVQKEPYEYDRILVFIGVKRNHDDDPMELAQRLLKDGLRLHFMTPVTRGNESKGIFKVELESQEDKILALKNSANLRNFNKLGT